MIKISDYFKETLHKCKHLIAQGDWKKVWIVCANEGFDKEDFIQLKFMFDKIGVNCEKEREEALIHSMRGIIEEIGHTGKSSAYYDFTEDDLLIIDMHRLRPYVQETHNYGYPFHKILEIMDKHREELSIVDFSGGTFLINLDNY